MIVYLDTSVILRPLLGQKHALRRTDWESAYASEILGLEARRVIDRLRLESALDDIGVMEAHRELGRIERCIGTVPLTRGVLRRAALPMPTVVKTLDAIHLTSALMLQEKLGAPITFATHDLQQATAAVALGFPVGRRVTAGRPGVRPGRVPG
jgi:predicted nucleic acid-binding protein